MATMAPDAAAFTAAWMLVQGLSALPSLSRLVYARSTYSVVGSTGMPPNAPAAHGATSQQRVSPGTAMRPRAQIALGRTGSQPRSPSCTKPSPQPPGGTPAAMQVPASSAHSPGGQVI